MKSCHSTALHSAYWHQSDLKADFICYIDGMIFPWFFLRGVDKRGKILCIDFSPVVGSYSVAVYLLNYININLKKIFLSDSFSETIVFPFLTKILRLLGGLDLCAWESEADVILFLCTVKSPQILTLNSLGSETTRSRQFAGICPDDVHCAKCSCPLCGDLCGVPRKYIVLGDAWMKCVHLTRQFISKHAIKKAGEDDLEFEDLSSRHITHGKLWKIPGSHNWVSQPLKDWDNEGLRNARLCNYSKI